MLNRYEDIRALTDKKPLWFDEHGVPRYAPFRPQLLGVYGEWAALMEIACQRCGERMWVGVIVSRFGWSGDRTIERQLPRKDEVGVWHYGDPPPHSEPLDQGCAGDTMNCYDLRIGEFWRRDTKPMYEWHRDRDYEIAWESEQAEVRATFGPRESKA